jgi:DDE superfamily endonuclease
MGEWRAEQMIFLDESGINPRTTERTHGWSKKGTTIRDQVPGPKRENYTILPALTVNGYIACNVYPGSVDGEKFKDFVEFDVLPHCTPYPGPRSVIILDNAAIHNVQSW